ncbi:MAG: hypothetical protein AB7N91_22230 [Candidatus Tectimicrobiota bacterium]
MIESPLQTQLAAFVDAPDDERALAYLQSQRQTLLTQAALEALTPLLEAEARPERRARIQARQAMLQAAIAFHDGFWKTQADLGDLLVTWVQTPDWDASEAYLQAHAAALLTDQGELALRFLCETQPNMTTLAEHLSLLQRCRAIGLAAAYEEVRRPQPELENVETLQQLMRAVFGFVQADSDAVARQLFETQPALLQVPDAEDLLEGLIQTAQYQDDTELQTRAEARLALWRTFRQA